MYMMVAFSGFKGPPARPTLFSSSGFSSSFFVETASAPSFVRSVFGDSLRFGRTFAFDLVRRLLLDLRGVSYASPL